MRTFPTLSKDRNKHGYYEIRWSEYAQGQWRSKRKSTKTGDKRRAEAALAEFLTSQPQKDTPMSFREVADSYLRNHSRQRGNEVSDARALRAPLGAFGDWPVTAIKNTDAETYSKQRQGGAYGPKAVKPSTVRREITAMQAAINWAVRRDMVEGREVRFDKPSDGAPRDKWLTEQQQAQILSALSAAPLSVQIFTKLGLTYGVRRGAIMDLHFEQINFLTGNIDFHRPGKAQNRKRRPVVPMTSSIRDLLVEAFKGKSAQDRVCDWNTPYQFKRFMQSIGFEWVTPHVLKHTAITLMLRDGVPPGDVSKLTSTDLRTIYRVYRHHTQAELLNIAERRNI